MTLASSNVRPLRWRRWGCLGAALLTCVVSGYVVYGGGEPLTRGVATRPVHARSRATAAPAEATTEILFGDLHVHTTFSLDAFLRSLPIAGGSGLHPPADACDFARYCSALDFYALTDHAETLTPRVWDEIKTSVRECNALAPDPARPDLVAFTGFEWTQIGLTPEGHYGHKNVIFRDIEDERLPARPIAAIRGDDRPRQDWNVFGTGLWRAPLTPILDFAHRDLYMDLFGYLQENIGLPRCPSGVNTRSLPLECRESATTPRELFEKLDQWGFDSIVIPHGTTWGFYTPPGYTWDKQLASDQDDADRQRLIEVFSGHGSAEEHRTFRDVIVGPNGSLSCPPPTEDYEPCCHRAGELVRARCADPSGEVCTAHVREARQAYVEAGVSGQFTLPWATVEDWGNCGQCTDCFNPAFNYRPGGSVQYIMARGGFEDPSSPRHHTFGFIGSSDNHTARPGTGYKEIGRLEFTETSGAPDENWRRRILLEREGPPDRAHRMEYDELARLPSIRQVYLERQMSFFMTGGLVAVHARGRDRAAIWEALRSRRVYGTSGDRIQLWFDLVESTGARHPMGSERQMGTTPVFEVRALGALEQQPGCPSWALEALGTSRLEQLCLSECHNPGDRRKRITRIEVVRITRQMREEETIESLIQDPFLVLPCEGQAEGACSVRFEDPTFMDAQREVLYYVRAIQEPTDAVNAGGVRCDESGVCRPCYGDYRTPRSDDCLAPNEERAWSSPIFLEFSDDSGT